MKIVNEWSQQSQIGINKKKSAILILRQDNRTKYNKGSTIFGIPIVNEAKYLGIYLNATGDYRYEKQAQQKKLIEF